jgi:hypothetical protein
MTASLVFNVFECRGLTFVINYVPEQIDGKA